MNPPPPLPPHQSQKSEGKERTEEEVQGDWRTAYAEDGRMYYWNVKTRASSWDKPY